MQLTQEALRAEISSGSVSNDALVWTDGLADWQPLGRIFVFPPGRIQAADSNVSSVSEAHERARPSMLGFSACILTLVVASWYLRASYDDILEVLRPTVGLAGAIGVHLGLLIVAACLGWLIVVLLWRHPARRGASAAAGLLLTLAVCLAVYESVNAASHAVAARDLYAIGMSNEDMDDAEMTIVSPGTASIVGSIGPNLMRDFLALEKAHGPIDAVEISSPGGLVEQALRLAEHVSSKQLKVLAQGRCLSACILVAVASPYSYATPDAVFGFHRTSPVTELTSAVANFGVQQMSSQSRAFLRSHGVPERVLEQASKHGRDSVFSVSAKEMVAFGALREIVPKGRFRTQ